jgi:predicted porin
MMNTQLKALPLLVASAIAAPAFANSPVQIYGQANFSADFLDGDSSGEGLNFSSNNSRLGFKGEHKFEDGLTAFFQVEATIQLDNGAAIQSDRDTFVGFKGDWGQLRGGRFDTPLKALRNRTDLFGNQVGDARNILRADGTVDGTTNWWDERLRNSIAYRSPVFAGGFTANLQYSSNQSNGTNNTSDNASYSASLEWQKDKLWIAVAHEDSVKTVGDERAATRFAISYEVGDILLNALYQQAEDPDNNAYGVGARYKLNDKVFLKGQYYILDTDANEEGASLAAVGVDYRYARNLLFYVNYASVSNEDLANRSPYRQGRTDGNLDPAAGETATGFSVGTSFRF